MNSADELRDTFLTKKDITRTVMDLLEAPYSSTGVFPIGNFSVNEEIIEKLEKTPLQYNQEFNKTKSFIWHPDGSQWDVNGDNSFPVSGYIRFKEDRVVIVPFILQDGVHSEGNYLFASILADEKLAKSHRLLRETKVSCEFCNFYLLYENLVKGYNSLWQCFEAFAADPFIKEIAGSSISPFKGSLNPTQEETFTLFVKEDIQHLVGTHWAQELSQFITKVKALE